MDDQFLYAQIYFYIIIFYLADKDSPSSMSAPSNSSMSNLIFLFFLARLDLYSRLKISNVN